MKYLGYGGTSTIFKGALCLCYRLKTNKLKSDIHVNMPQKRKFNLSLDRKHNRTIKRSAHDLKAIVVFHYPLYVVCNPSMCKRLCILCPGQIVFSSPEPKARVSYCHSAPSVVRPSSSSVNFHIFDFFSRTA